MFILFIYINLFATFASGETLYLYNKFFILTLFYFMTGNEVRSILIEKGFVLAEIADKLGITAQTLNSRLNAKNFKNEYISELSSVLGISFETQPYQSIDNLMSLIESQQRTIESLSRTIENLSKK